MSNRLRALIVDDERLVREDLRFLLYSHDSIEIVAEADSLGQAVAALTATDIDVVFLDIQLGKESGFSLFDLIEVNFEVVFVTAFDSYAIRAFEVNALDYLLKPVDPKRLAETVARLSRQRKNRGIKEKQLRYDDYIFVQSGGRAGFIKVNTIVSIRANGYYTEIQTVGGERRLILKSLKEWEQCLPTQYFLRIHRASIINIEYVERLEPVFKSTYEIYLRNTPEPLAASRKYAAELRKRFD
ncbi:MAG: LytTR family DNA-binding domain-containing protein [Acidobacteriota bacterium]